MRKLKQVLVVLMAALLFVLSGCSENTVRETKAENQQKVSQIEKVKAEVKPVVINVIDPNDGKIIKTILPKEIGYETNLAAYKEEIENWARDLARGTKDHPGYDKRMILDKVDKNGQVIKGTPQTILDEDELTSKVIEASEKGGDVILPLYSNASGYNIEEAGQLDEVVVASYKTYFNSGTTGRSKNIELAAQAINNVIIGSEDQISFNTTVGPSDAEHGYQPAPEVVKGKLVDGVGGGICQVSSTLYNAIDQLGVQYIEHNHHSLHVGYVPTGRDATVSYGGADFRFKNTTGVPLLIRTIVSKGSVTVEIRTAKVYQNQVKKGI